MVDLRDIASISRVRERAAQLRDAVTVGVARGHFADENDVLLRRFIDTEGPDYTPRTLIYCRSSHRLVAVLSDDGVTEWLVRTPHRPNSRLAAHEARWSSSP
jgi:hypothetical protein